MGSITLETERKFWFLHPLDHRKMQLLKPGKYSVMNKSTAFAPFYYLYVKPLNFASFLHKSQQLYFFRKTGIQVETGITCLLTINKYLHQLPLIVSKERKITVS